MDKGILIGAEIEVATRSNLPFAMFRHATSVSTTTGTRHILTLVFAVSSLPSPYPTVLPRSSTAQGSRFVCFSIPASGIFCTRLGNPSAHRGRSGSLCGR